MTWLEFAIAMGALIAGFGVVMAVFGIVEMWLDRRHARQTVRRFDAFVAALDRPDIGFVVESPPMTSTGSKGATFIGYGSTRDVTAYRSTTAPEEENP